MRRYHGGLIVGAACGALVACAGGSPIPGEQPADSPVETTTRGGTDNPATTTRDRPQTSQTSKREPPGVPGSPIDYDSTVLAAGAKGARNSVLRELEEACGPGRCGVTVVIVGKGDCAARIAPDPVYPGGTVTVTATSCESTEESTPEESTAESSSGGENTESGG